MSIEHIIVGLIVAGAVFCLVKKFDFKKKSSGGCCGGSCKSNK